MSSEDKNEPNSFCGTNRRSTGEFPSLAAVDIERTASRSGESSEEDDWSKTALFKTPRVQSAQPPQDLTSSIAVSVVPNAGQPATGRGSSAGRDSFAGLHLGRSSVGRGSAARKRPSLALRPELSSSSGTSFLDSVRTMSRPIAAVVLGLVVVGAAVAFIVSQETDTVEAASSEGVSGGSPDDESPPLAPVLVDDLSSSGSPEPDETEEVEESTTTSTSTTLPAPVEVIATPLGSSESKKSQPETEAEEPEVETDQPAGSTTTTTKPSKGKMPVDKQPTTEETTTTTIEATTTTAEETTTTAEETTTTTAEETTTTVEEPSGIDN